MALKLEWLGLGVWGLADNSERLNEWMEPVTMTCMTTKKKFEVEKPEVVVLKNNRFAYRAKCPWNGKNDRELYAFKFCSAAAYEQYSAAQNEDTEQAESEHVAAAAA